VSRTNATTEPEKILSWVWQRAGFKTAFEVERKRKWFGSRNITLDDKSANTVDVTVHCLPYVQEIAAPFGIGYP
jgi:hypothetical protein